MTPRRILTPIVLALFGAATALTAPAFAAGPSPTVDASATMAATVRAQVARMSLTDKVEQMFVTYAYGTSANAEDATDVAENRALYGNDVDNGADLLAKYHLGGIIYFAWSNVLTDPQQIATLSNGLQTAALANSAGVPVQISTDQEGGIVNRIGAPAAVSPGNMALGATADPLNAYRAASVSGAELRAMGINMDDAPVVDVNTNPQNSADGPRSFGDRPLAVAADAAAAITGYQQAGVAAQAKHFPGLGDTTVNTDNGVAVNNETKAQIMATDIPPFQAAIAAGARSIMAAHIVAPALDPSGLPASLSEPIVTGLLRNTLHYNGVVITDSLAAGALASIPQSQVMLDAINAGDDELLMPTDLPSAIQTVLDAVQAGTISVARIDQSVTRILTMKAAEGLFTNPYTTAAAVTATVGTPAHLNTMAAIDAKSITLVRNNSHVLPLASTRTPHVLVTGWGVSTTQSVADSLTGKGFTVQHLWTGSPSAATISAAVTAAQANDVTVVLTENAWGDTTQQSLVNALLAAGKPVVVASVGGPYDLSYFPSAPTYVAAYGYQPGSLTALVNTLTGTNPTGKLPVTIPNAAGTATLAPYGTGLHY
ncbi:MAG TPA: glycoside hydrolase family 3 N-terminal domain-containing protein [Pseudonocardiaceae bacterium]|jgi:beta-N-acetylhexosaminidase|nr:glycoside hydrolase family 3 N-terminal domain-containing protein [Pseudonocardiaceae bacterium]